MMEAQDSFYSPACTPLPASSASTTPRGGAGAGSEGFPSSTAAAQQHVMHSYPDANASNAAATAAASANVGASAADGSPSGSRNSAKRRHSSHAARKDSAHDPASADDSQQPLNYRMNRSRLPALRSRLEHFTLYETRSKLYLVGWGSPQQKPGGEQSLSYRILKMNRMDSDYAALLNAGSLAFADDGLTYDSTELAELLRMIDQGNASVGGLKEVASNICGIIGFVRFVQGYYLILGTNRKLVGKIGGHLIYEVGDTIIFPVTHPSVYDLGRAGGGGTGGGGSMGGGAGNYLPSPSSAANALLNTIGLRGNVTPSSSRMATNSSNSSSRSPQPSTPSSASAAAASPGGSSAASASSVSKLKTNESRYRNLFSGLDLSKNFYFCPTGYELTQSLQANMLHAGRTGGARAPRPKAMYMWNQFMLSKFYRCMARQARDEAEANGTVAAMDAPEEGDEDADEDEEEESRQDEQGVESEMAYDASLPHSADSAPTRSSPTSRRAHLNPAAQWSIPLIHGYFVQTHVSVFGNTVDLTLLARRSRFFAGTRYLKRGINSAGKSANDVESEQICWNRSRGDHLEGAFTSYLQVRASIPLFWSQEGNPLVAQPAIVVTKVDPLHLATRCHAEDLLRRYGSPLLVLNLVKQHEKARRESIIGEALADSIGFINNFISKKEHKIDFLAWDFKRVSKSKTHSVIDELGVISQWSLQRTGLFASRPHPLAFPTCAVVTQGIKPTRESIRAAVGAGGEAAGFNMAGTAVVAGAATGGGGAAAVGGAEASDSAAIPSYGHLPPGTLLPKTSSSSSAATTEPPSGLLAAAHRQRNFFNLSAHLAAHGYDPSSAASDALTGPISRPLSRSSALPFPPPSPPVQHLAFLQRGVTRTNCIDSLDRTNVAQFCIGKAALGYQLFALGLTDSVHLAQGTTAGVGEGQTTTTNGVAQPATSGANNLSGPTGGSNLVTGSVSSEIVNILLELYEGMGDVLSQQYGGSAMHRSLKTDRSKDGKTSTLSQGGGSSSQPSEVLTSIRRHIQNSFQDNGKQDAINLFLGYFIPPDHNATQPSGGAGVAGQQVMVAGSGVHTNTSSTTPAHRGRSLSSFFPFATAATSGASGLLGALGGGDRSGTGGNTSGSGGGSSSLVPIGASGAPVGPGPLVAPHIWDLTSDYYLHNPRTINVLNKVQYNLRALRRDQRRQARKMAKVAATLSPGSTGAAAAAASAAAGASTALVVGTSPLSPSTPSSYTTLVPSSYGNSAIVPFSSSSSSSSAATGHPALELGHCTYPDDSWWANPLREFERPLRGYIPDWLLSLPPARRGGTKDRREQPQRDPRIKDVPKRNPSLTSRSRKKAAAAAADSTTGAAPLLPQKKKPLPPPVTVASPALSLAAGPGPAGSPLAPIVPQTPSLAVAVSEVESSESAVGGVAAAPKPMPVVPLQIMAAEPDRQDEASSSGMLSPSGTGSSAAAAQLVAMDRPPSLPPSRSRSPSPVRPFPRLDSGSSPLSKAKEHRSNLYWANVHAGLSNLSSFDELLASDVYRNHNIRILSAPGASVGNEASKGVGSEGASTAAAAASTPSSSSSGASAPTPSKSSSTGYASLLPRFLWKRLRAEDAASDDDADEDTPAAANSGPAGANNTASGGSGSSSTISPSKVPAAPTLDATRSWGLDGPHAHHRAGMHSLAMSPSPLSPASDAGGDHGSAFYASSARFDETPISPRGGLGLHSGNAGGSEDNLSAFLPKLSASSSSVTIHTPGGGNLSSAAAGGGADMSMMLSLGGMTGSTSHFSATGPPRLTSAQHDAVNAASLYLEYVHAPFLGALSAAPLAHKIAMVTAHAGVGAPGLSGGSIGAEVGSVTPAAPVGAGAFVTSVEHPSAADRKMLHFLDHYAHMRVEHNLIVEPHALAEHSYPLSSPLSGAAAAAAVTATAAQAHARTQRDMAAQAAGTGAGAAVSQNYFSNASAGIQSPTTAAATLTKKQLPQKAAPLPPGTITSPTVAATAASPASSTAATGGDNVAAAPTTAPATSPSSATSAAASSSLSLDPALSVVLSPQSSPAAAPLITVMSPTGSVITHSQASPEPTPLLGAPPTPLAAAPVFPAAPPKASTDASAAAAAVTAASSPSPAPPLPPRRSVPLTSPRPPGSIVAASSPSSHASAGFESPHRRDLLLSAAASASSLTSPSSSSSSLPLHPSPLPVFSHAPPSSSISLRNAKKAHFYLSYLRRGQLDEPFLQSTFAWHRHAAAHEPISIELEDDRRSAEMYAAYVDSTHLG